MMKSRIRYDPDKGIYWDCKYCGGKGCLACPGEAEKEYRRQFPDGPKPIATFRRDDPKDMARFNETFGTKALAKAFSPGGGGIDGILQKLGAEAE